MVLHADITGSLQAMCRASTGAQGITVAKFTRYLPGVRRWASPLLRGSRAHVVTCGADNVGWRTPPPLPHYHVRS